MLQVSLLDWCLSATWEKKSRYSKEFLLLWGWNWLNSHHARNSCQDFQSQCLSVFTFFGNMQVSVWPSRAYLFNNPWQLFYLLQERLQPKMPKEHLLDFTWTKARSLSDWSAKASLCLSKSCILPMPSSVPLWFIYFFTLFHFDSVQFCDTCVHLLLNTYVRTRQSLKFWWMSW